MSDTIPTTNATQELPVIRTLADMARIPQGNQALVTGYVSDISKDWKTIRVATLSGHRIVIDIVDPRESFSPIPDDQFVNIVVKRTTFGLTAGLGDIMFLDEENPEKEIKVIRSWIDIDAMDVGDSGIIIGIIEPCHIEARYIEVRTRHGAKFTVHLADKLNRNLNSVGYYKIPLACTDLGVKADPSKIEQVVSPEESDDHKVIVKELSDWETLTVGSEAVLDGQIKQISPDNRNVLITLRDGALIPVVCEFGTHNAIPNNKVYSPILLDVTKAEDQLAVCYLDALNPTETPRPKSAFKNMFGQPPLEEEVGSGVSPSPEVHPVETVILCNASDGDPGDIDSFRKLENVIVTIKDYDINTSRVRLVASPIGGPELRFDGWFLTNDVEVLGKVEPLEIEAGKAYRNGLGQVITIVEKLETSHDLYLLGYRFRGEDDQFYTENGIVDIGASNLEQNLVKEIPISRRSAWEKNHDDEAVHPEPKEDALDTSLLDDMVDEARVQQDIAKREKGDKMIRIMEMVIDIKRLGKEIGLDIDVTL